MSELISIKEAAEILDVTLSTVSYYIRTGKLTGIESDSRTAHKRKRKLLEKSDVLRLKNLQSQDS